MTYEVRLRKRIGGLGIVAVYKDDQCVAEAVIDPRTPIQKAQDTLNVEMFDFGELPPNIQLQDFEHGEQPLGWNAR